MTLYINNLAFERNNEVLFAGIHSTLQSSEMLQICGPNGCGKSTLLRILAGYIQPETGTILWHGKNIFATLDDYAQQLCYLGHQNGIKPYLTTCENLKLSCALSNKKMSREELKKVLRTMQLESVENTQAMHLSQGQKRRLALCRLQITSARLWILDEPTTALDHPGQTLLTDLLKQHLKNDGMAIVATHHDLGVSGSKTLELTAHV